MFKLIRDHFNSSLGKSYAVDFFHPFGPDYWSKAENSLEKRAIISPFAAVFCVIKDPVLKCLESLC